MKRVLSFLMVLLLVVGLVPMQAKAEGAEKYNVTINITGKGTASASPATAAAGETVTIDFEADETSGHEFKECTVHFPDGSVMYLNYWEQEFTMPEGDVTVKVKFGPIGDGDDWEDETEAYVVYYYYTTAGAYLSEGIDTATPDTRYQFVPLDGYEIDKIDVTNAYGATLTPDASHGVVVPAGGVAAVVWLKQGGGNEPQPAEYDITVTTATNGTVSASATKAKKDEVINVSATANAGYELDKITVTDADGNDVNVTDGKFTMPASDVTVAATFKAVAAQPAEYNITVAAVSNGTVDTSATKAKEGEVITVTATAGNNYELDKITVTDEEDNEITVTDGKFTMPASNVTVKVTFKQKPVSGLTFSYAYDVYRDPAYPKKNGSFRVYNHAQPLDANGRRIDNAGTWTLTPMGKYANISNPTSGLRDVVTELARVYGVSTSEMPVHKLTLNGNFITYGVLVMHNPSEPVAFFIGSNYSGGAGYLFCNIRQSGSKTYDVTTDVTDDVLPEKEKVTVTFNANSGSCDVPSLEVESGSSLSSIPTATREGYTFAGWVTSAGKKITTSTKFTENTTVYARWAAHTTSPSDNDFRGDIAMPNEDVVDMLLTEEDLAKGLDVNVYLEVEERSATTVPAGDHAAIVAKAGNDEVVAYLDIQLLKEFSDGTRENITNTKNEYVPISLKLTDALIPENAVADSFYILYHHVENGSAVTGKLAATFNPATKMLSFRANKFSTYALAYTTYQVSFDANGGSGTMDGHTVPAGSSYTLPTCSFKAPSGKQFSHWEVNGAEKKPADVITVSGNTTVTAVWKASSGKLDNSPKAGDISGLNMMTMVILFSAAALAGIAIYDKKRAR